MNSNDRRIVAGALIALIVGFTVSLANGRDVVASAGSGVVFALIVTTLVAGLAWAIETAERKGYSPWVGVLLIVALNIPGILLLLLMPSRRSP